VPVGRWRNHVLLHIDLPAPDDSVRATLWAETLSAYGIALPETEVDGLAGRFRFTRGQMEAALRSATHAARLKPAGESQITASDVARACRSQSGPLLTGLAQHIEPRYGWSDIVLPANALAQMREICAQVRFRRRVYGEWGFGEKMARGKGLAALFSGPSGTGKTMAAEIIAGDLELDLYRIDLASVVSKYIGETEKNLAKIFVEAERASAVLFFDEADALFGKRSEVKDAHDRYANIEISYLLQRVESYEGVVILATNLKKNVDEAFIRRLQFLVEFPFPDEAQRRLIWLGQFPPRAPRAAALDLNFLAEHLALAGGNIKNVVLHAAFLAAANGGEIGMSHIMRAAKREYDKIGRLGSETDFGPYWHLVTEDEQ
jgi:SpoVK/Ycf46/Vps4 family AAA+-type ATPase